MSGIAGTLFGSAGTAGAIGTGGAVGGAIGADAIGLGAGTAATSGLFGTGGLAGTAQAFGQQQAQSLINPSAQPGAAQQGQQSNLFANPQLNLLQAIAQISALQGQPQQNLPQLPVGQFGNQGRF